MTADASATPTPSDPWLKLTEELNAWAAEGLSAAFWWRDDDATTVTPALKRLLSISRIYGAPVGLAVIPRGAEPALAEELAAHPLVWVLQHGIAHVSHRTDPHSPNIELGGSRTLDELVAELPHSRRPLEAMFGERLIPVLVPPWNQIDPVLVEQLPALGYCGLSTSGPRQRRVAGLVETNGHINPINWAGGAHYAGTPAPMEQALRHLWLRRSGRADRNEPIGLLTHHLAMDEDSWTFVETFLAVTRGHPAARWADPRQAFELL
jgi:hypothetical protein